MATRRFEVSFLEGQVAKVEDKGERYHLTVEVAEERRAYGMTVEAEVRPLEGRWVRFRGHGSLTVGPGGRERKKTYYHNPLDGTPRQQWDYLELWNAEVSQVGHPDLMALIRDCQQGLMDLDMDFSETWSDLNFMHRSQSRLALLVQAVTDRTEALSGAPERLV